MKISFSIECEPYEFWSAHERDEENYMSRLPACESCGERIQSEYVWEIGGHKYCEECARDMFCTPLGVFVDD